MFNVYHHVLAQKSNNNNNNNEKKIKKKKYGEPIETKCTRAWEYAIHTSIEHIGELGKMW